MSIREYDLTPVIPSSDAARAFVAVDWGTSSFRGWLMSAKGDVLAESRGGEGMLHCAGSGFAPFLRDHLAKLGAPEKSPVLICGMAGARLLVPAPPHPDRFELSGGRIQARQPPPGFLHILGDVAVNFGCRRDPRI